MHNDQELNKLKKSFAIVIREIILADKTVTTEERNKFDSFFKNEFNLSQSEINTLYVEAINDEMDLDSHILLLKEGFKNKAMLTARFMQFLNETILSDGIEDKEYETFEMINQKLIR